MRTKTAFYFVLLGLAAGVPTYGQGTFQNLSFESPVTPLVPVEPVFGFVPITNALPGWSAYVGTTPQALVLHNNFFLATPTIALLGWGTPVWSPPIEGNYSVLLQAGTYPDQTGGFTAAIAQTGLVPATARSLQFKVTGTDFEIRVGGQVIPMFEMAGAANYKLFGGDISGFAGLSAELRLTALSPAAHSGNWVYLDSIVFSPQVIPEPGMLGLSLFGGLLFGWRAIRKRDSCLPVSPSTVGVTAIRATRSLSPG